MNMAKVITCPMCGKQFETSRPNKKYCCFSCKDAGRRLQRMKWETKNPHYITTYMKKYRTARKKGQSSTETKPPTVRARLEQTGLRGRSRNLEQNTRRNR